MTGEQMNGKDLLEAVRFFQELAAKLDRMVQIGELTHRLETEDDIRGWRDEMLNVAKHHMLRDGEVDSVILALNEEPGGKQGMLMMDVRMFMRTQESKQLLSELLPEMFRRAHAFIYVMVSEVWFLTTDKQIPVAAEQDMPLPSESQDRKEGLHVRGEWKNHPSFSCLLEVVRDSEGNVTDLKGPEGFEEEKEPSVGRFTNLLIPPMARESEA